MSGRAYQPRLLFMWPNARIGVMGGEQAAQVLAEVKRNNLARHGENWSEEDEAQFKDKIRLKYEDSSNCYHATARLWDDGIIKPTDTRHVLALGLRMALKQPIPDTKFGVFRM